MPSRVGWKCRSVLLDVAISFTPRLAVSRTDQLKLEASAKAYSHAPWSLAPDCCHLRHISGAGVVLLKALLGLEPVERFVPLQAGNHREYRVGQEVGKFARTSVRWTALQMIV